MKTQIRTVGDVGVLQRWISLITNPLHCWAPIPLSQIHISFLENLGQTSGEYPTYRQNLGWSAKSKIPDRLRFSRHMKTRLYREIGNEQNPSPTDADILDVKNFEFWIFREWSPTIAGIWDASGSRNALDSRDLSPFIPDDRGYLRFQVFISRQNLGRSGNSKIPSVWDFPDIWKPGFRVFFQGLLAKIVHDEAYAHIVY